MIHWFTASIPRSIVVPIGLSLCVWATPAAKADPLHEIFYAPFDGSPDAVIARGLGKPYQFRIDSYEDGVVGRAAHSVKRYNGIRYDGRGNIDLDRGTFALFYKPLFEPDVAAWQSLCGVSTDVEGYWAGVIQFMNKKTMGSGNTFALHFFDIGRTTPVLEFQPIYQRWHKGQWHHLAVVWDRHEGITIYEDGKRAASNWGKYRWAWNQVPRMLVFGNWQYSTAPFAVDEVHVYASCLTDAQIAQLAKGENPTGQPIPIKPPAERRPAELARMGWKPEDLAEMPVVKADSAIRFTFARVLRSIDAKRLVAQPFEGLLQSCWPLQKYGASTKGRSLEIRFAQDQTFDRVRLFAHHVFSGRLQEVLPGVGTKDLLEIDAPRPNWRARFGDVRRDRSLILQRDGGSLGQIDFFSVDSVSVLPKNLLTYGAFERLDRMPTTLAGRAALGDTPARFDNPARAVKKGDRSNLCAAPSGPSRQIGPVPFFHATAETKQWTSTSPAFGGFQLLTPMLTEPTAMDGVILKLVTEGLTEPTPVRIVVKEPVLPQRQWLAADVILQPNSQPRQSFSIHLTGRSVVNHPKREQEFRGADHSEPGREVAVLVTAANPVTWVMGDDGCCLSLCLADMETALPIAVQDQVEYAREAYAEHNEGHIWDNISPPGWGRLYYPLKWLMAYAPEERAAMQLADRVGWRDEPLPFAEPTNDTGAPDWAFWQMQAMNECKRIVHWIIDNRQVENGELGGVWGDDTDMLEYWSDYALACDDDRKITDALRRFWDGVYEHSLVEGVSRTIRDNLHSYEEGMGCISHQLLVDYGDPTAIEHVMRACSHYYPKWMTKNDDGTYSFRSNYLGYPGVYTEGGMGRDVSRNGLLLFPAAYLTWYNRHPEATKYVLNWKLSPEAGGLVGDAYLRLKYPDDDERKKLYLERVKKGEPRTRPLQLNALLDETGMRDEWQDWLVKGAKANSWRFFSGELPKYAGYSPRMTEYFWLAYRATGDMDYLVQSYKQACMFINNQDWLYTVAQPSTDRIPLPRTSVIRARLGSLAVQRGASELFWPRHGLSYTKGSHQVSALVTQNTDTTLQSRFYSFADKNHDLELRVWRLLPGTYKATLSHDRNDDGVAEAAISKQTLALDRGAYVNLTLPPRQSSILNIEAVKTHEPAYDLPDPSIGPADLHLESGGTLHIKVHNVGTRPVENLSVRATDVQTGTVIGQATVDTIPPPLDLQPKISLLAIPNADALSKGTIAVELDPERKHPDMNRYNNRVVFRH